MGVDVGRIEEVDTCLQTEVNLPARALDVRCAHFVEERLAAEGHRAQAKHRNAETGLSKLTIFHN